jgi:hypothetical protein
MDFFFQYATSAHSCFFTESFIGSPIAMHPPAAAAVVPTKTTTAAAAAAAAAAVSPLAPASVTAANARVEQVCPPPLPPLSSVITNLFIFNFYTVYGVENYILPPSLPSPPRFALFFLQKKCGVCSGGHAECRHGPRPTISLGGGTGGGRACGHCGRDDRYATSSRGTARYAFCVFCLFH